MAGPSNVKRAPAVRPAFNAFSLLDHQTGNYLVGKDGAFYLNGGLHHVMGYAGRGNTFKTALSNFVSTVVAIRQDAEFYEIYDTEMSFKVSRLATVMRTMIEAANLDAEDLILSGKWNISTSIEQLGDEWWKALRDDVPARRNLKEKELRSTPFINFDGSAIKVPSPWLFGVDSFTEMKVANVEKMHDKAVVGNSDLNTEAMKSGAAKSQMMAQMPIVSGAGYYYISLTAHVGDEIKMDQYSPSHRKLAGLKGDLKLKGIPEKFTFLANNCYMATAVGNLLDDKKMPKYPHPDKVPMKGDTDLQIVRFEQLRGKSGPTGVVLDLIFSQEEGLQVGLSEFYYLTDMCANWGMEAAGNNAWFKLSIYPEVRFTRNTVRQYLRDDPKFARAMAITCACAYMHHNWVTHPAEMRISMEEMYTSITNQGYSWDEILSNTVEYWYFDDMAEKIGKPTLTAYTLQRMAIGKYTAKFLSKEKAATAA